MHAGLNVAIGKLPPDRLRKPDYGGGSGNSYNGYGDYSTSSRSFSGGGYSDAYAGYGIADDEVVPFLRWSGAVTELEGQQEGEWTDGESLDVRPVATPGRKKQFQQPDKLETIFVLLMMCPQLTLC